MKATKDKITGGDDFLQIWSQIDRQTDRHTHTHTHKQSL